MRRGALEGLLLTPLLMFVVGPLVGLVFRFPVPLAGYLSGPDAVIPSAFAVAFYGILLGLFIPLAIVGAVCGDIALRLRNGRSTAFIGPVFVSSLMVDLVAALLLATWDWIYGPW